MIRRLALLVLLCGSAAHGEILLDGRSASPATIARIADGETVKLAPDALARVAASHRALLAAARAGQKIYGLTVGVGLNKDRPMVDARGDMSAEARAASRDFNIALLHSHAGGIGPDMPVRLARAAMAARLNGLLAGNSGIQPAITELYGKFLNLGITPAMPAEGSIGEADITLLSHVGLAMLGEGDVYWQGRKIKASEALKAAGISPIEPFAKDALAIMSSNAYAAGMAALALDDLERLARVAKAVFALSLEGLDGNVSPFLQDTLALRPFPETQAAGRDLRALLEGSSLWTPDDRPLQDPLSFRSAVYIFGELDRTTADARALLAVQLNSSDDNPGVSGDEVLPSANFEPLPWVISFEQLGVALGHHALASAQRIVKLDDPHFTGLSRYLAGPGSVHAFGAMEKPAMTLATDIKELALPVSLDFLPAAGGIEDIATNAPRAVERVQRQIDDSFVLAGIELIHAAQAIDLRRAGQPAFKLSPATAPLFEALRRAVPFLDKDRSMTGDFRAAADLLRRYDGKGTAP